MRSRFVVPALVVLAVSTLTLACRAAGPPPATAQFRGDAAHLGAYGPGAGDSLAGIAWRFGTGGAVRASVVAAGGVVYGGGSDGVFHALDAATGAERWHADLGSSIGDAPAIAGGLVVVGTRDGRVVALDVAHGRTRWTARTGKDRPMPWGREGFDFWTSSPAMAGGAVYVGGGDGAVYALDLSTGHVRWRAATGGRVRAAPAVAGGTVYAGSCDGSLYALDAATGKPRWRFDSDGRGFDSGHFGFDRKSIYAPAAVAGGRVYVGGRDGKFYALDAATGHELWRSDFGTSWVMGGAALAGDRVYVTTSDGHLVRCLARADGKELWHHATASALWASPALTGGLAIVTDWGGDVLALDAATGAEAWRERLPRAVLTAACPDREHVFVSCDDGGIYALARGARPLVRAVYWDTTLAGSPKAMQGATEVRDYFRRLGWRVLDGNALVDFLAARARDGAPSTIVCALDGLPDAATADGADGPPLLRRYLEAGGHVTWLGDPPRVSGDPMKDMTSLAQIDRAAPGKLLGVDFAPGNYDPLPAYPTAGGRAWGLSHAYVTHWAASAASVTTVLARDENGDAGAWVRAYGAHGGRFVLLPLVFPPGGHPSNLLDVQVVAERL